MAEMYEKTEINIERGKSLTWVLAACSTSQFQYYPSLRNLGQKPLCNLNLGWQQWWGSPQAHRCDSNSGLNSHRAWERRSCSLHFPKASTNSERIHCACTHTETCSWRPQTSECTCTNSCWKALLDDHLVTQQIEFCCLNTDLKARHRQFLLRLVDLRLNQLPELLGVVVRAMHDLGFYV